MPEMLAKYDALVFPSEWEEPFGRMVMEAMAVGLVVIGTTTGGTGDVLVEGQTGLTFPAGDHGALARQIERLRDDRALGRRLANTAYTQVSQRFTFDRMVDEIEAFLSSLALVETAS
jgi:glycosyltransferase involved in cell wall biosynthesis